MVIVYYRLEDKAARAYRSTVVFADDQNAIVPTRKAPRHSLTVV
jgi:aspartate 1-decarboxylase